jgi:oxazoline/thiazoline synthase
VTAAAEPVPGRRLRLRADVRADVLDAGHVLVVDDGQARVLTGRAVAAMVPLLDGNRTVDQLVTSLHPGVFPAEVYFAADLLARSGLTVDGPPGDPAEEAFWNSAGLSAADAGAALGQATVEVVALSAAPDGTADAIARALEGLGVGARRGPGAGRAVGDLVVAVTDHYLHPGLGELNAHALRTGRPWMMARSAGARAWVGPLFVPARTACWACLAERLRRNRQVEDFVVRHRGYPAPPSPTAQSIRATLTAVASLTALAAAGWLARGTSDMEGAVVTLGARDLEWQRHAVVRRPQCPACGDPDTSAHPRPVNLSAVPGGPRPPEATLADLDHQINPITGVVTALVDLGHEPGVAYNYAAGHNFAMGLDDANWLGRSLRTLTGGKGRTDAQARMSAVGEAIERYNGVWRGDEHRVRASYRDLAGRAVHVHDLLHFSDRQYAGRFASRNASTPKQLVPNPFDEDQAIDWSAAWSLRDGVARYLPSSYCWYGHPDSAEHFFCTGDTSGCAAGSTLADAVLRALLELVERDSVAVWWYNRLLRPAVDLDGCGLPDIERARQYHDRLGRDLWALDLTADLGVACVAAVSSRRSGPSGDVVFGFAAHLAPEAALLGAVAEANQFLPAVSEIGPDGRTVYAWPEEDAIAFWRHENIESQPYLAPGPHQPGRPLAALPRLGEGEPAADVAALVDLLGRRGLDVLVLDQTRPDVELHVARAVVPGLRHFWRRLGPGRLYDVPVQMGWLEAPLGEDQLNPLSVFV